MQLATNLISKQRLLELVKAVEEEDKDEKEEEISPDAPGSLNLDEENNELELLIMEIEEKQSKKSKADTDKENKKDKTIKEIIDKINKKFGKKGKREKKGHSRSDYLKEEFFSKNQYGTQLQALFDYLGTGTVKDIYKAFYSKAKDNIYNFEDEMLSKAQQEKIVQRTKLARWMGYKGDAVYCSHEQLDAHTREKWELIRNICYVFTLTMLRYEMSLS